MELKLELDEREVDFELGEERGRGIKDLINFAGKHEFGEIVINGETKSYSFLRQIALLINLLISLDNKKLTLKSNSFTKKDGYLLPIYE